LGGGKAISANDEKLRYAQKRRGSIDPGRRGASLPAGIGARGKTLYFNLREKDVTGKEGKLEVGRGRELGGKGGGRKLWGVVKKA